MEAKTSILLVNKNHGQYLSDCLSSIRSQKIKNLNVIVLDGGSTDDSQVVASRFPEFDFISTKDFGSNHAYAKGVSLIKTKYVTFLTSTDLLHDNNWLAKAEEELERNDELSMVVGGISGYGPESDYSKYRYPTYKLKENDYATMYEDWLFAGNGLTPISFLARLSVVKDCLSPLEQFFAPDSLVPTDLFFMFAYRFYTNRYLATYIGNNQVLCRLHTDRRNDFSYLRMQQKQLRDQIRNERARALRSKQKLQFLKPDGVISDFNIPYFQFVLRYVKWRFKYFSVIFHAKRRDNLAFKVYGEVLHRIG